VPSVTVAAAAPDGTRVEAHARASGGTPPYTYLWAGSDPDVPAGADDSVSYVPRMRDFRAVLPAQAMERTEHLSVTVIDANGVRVQAGDSVHVTAQPAPPSHNSVTYGCESPNDPGPSPTDGSYAPERIAWQQAMGAAGQGGGSQRFCWLADDSWPGDFIEPAKPGSLEPAPWIYGDADYSNWGINTTNIMLYNGDGSPWGFSEMYPGATPADYNTGGGGGLSTPGSGDVQIGGQSYTVGYNGGWGAPHEGGSLQWLAMYACQILNDDADNPPPWQRWGPAFNGLHSMLGFASDASDAGVGFMTDFPVAILGLDFIVDIPVQLQESQLQDKLTVAEAMRLYASFYRRPADIDQLLAMLDLTEKRNTRYRRLSGGQKQRLSIALALIGRPRIAILDELTTGLDPVARRDSWQLIDDIRNSGVTIMLITHLMTEAERLCDRVAIMRDGRIVALGTPAALGRPTLEDAFVALTDRRVS